MLYDVGAAGEKIGLAISQAINLTGLVPWGSLIAVIEQISAGKAKLISIFQVSDKVLK